MNTRTRQLTIQTPEGIRFSLKLAGPFARLMALIIDKFVVITISGILTFIFRLLSIVSEDFFGAVLAITAFLLSFGYPIGFEWGMRGQTIGKKILRIRVMDEQNLRLTFSQIVIRNLLRVVDVLPAFYMVGGLACVWTQHAQRLGDLVANTVVVEHPKISEPDLTEALPDKYNSFRDHPHLAARLRATVTPVEAGLALQALLRRNELDDDARLNVFSELKQRFASKVRFPADLVDDISDEQYTRNVIDILFR
jgi:uncharacterized RDD family membrane protein YckC